MFSAQDKQHILRLKAQELRIKRIYDEATKELLRIAQITDISAEEKPFAFADYPSLKPMAQKVIKKLGTKMLRDIDSEVLLSETLSSKKFSDILEKAGASKRQIKASAEVLDRAEMLKNYYDTRLKDGLDISAAVWNYADMHKAEIENAITYSLLEGESASDLARNLKQHLLYPDKIFRRIRDEYGALKLSKSAKAFHPGRGVYRSSRKNALRLAATETNISYRSRDFERWQELDFVVGIEIRLSNNHTLNGKPFTDICDELQGKYPKGFKFTGWHPFCRCHAVPILKNEDELDEAEDTPSENEIREMPEVFRSWQKKNADRIKRALESGKAPYFLAQNKKIINKVDGYILGYKSKSGGYVLISKERISKSQSSKNEKQKFEKELNMAKVFADNGYKIELLKENTREPSSDVKINGVKGDLKSTKGHNNIMNYAKKAIRKQDAKAVLFEIDEETEKVHWELLKTKNIDKDIEIYYYFKDAKKVYKLQNKTEAMSNLTTSESAVRPHLKRWGESLDLDNKVSKPTAKIERNSKTSKPTSKEISALRHSKRSPELVEAIKKRWAERAKTIKIAKADAKKLLSTAEEYKDIDTAIFKKAIKKGDLKKLKTLSENIKLSIKNIKVEGEKLTDIIPDVHKWHKQFGIEELKSVHSSVSKKLKTIDNLPLSEQSNKLSFEIEQAEKIKKHSTWEIARNAYKSKLKEVKYKIEKEDIQSNSKDALDFAKKTKSTKVKKLAEELNNLLDKNAPISEIKKKAEALNSEYSRLESAKANKNKDKNASPFSADAYTKERKDKAIWDIGDGKLADDTLIDIAGKNWIDATNDERESAYGYTRFSDNVNYPLQGRVYIYSQTKDVFLNNVNNITSYISKNKLPEDMWFTRGDEDLNAIASRIKFAGGVMPDNLQDLVGMTMQEGGFLSTACRKGAGFQYHPVILHIYAPKGTQAAYLEPFSRCGQGAGLEWDGKERFTSFGGEQEALFQRGTIMRITKVYQSEGKTFVDCEVIEQEIKSLSYVKDYHISY